MSEASMNLPIYLDYNATTPVAPEVAAAMRPWLEAEFGNPSSAHGFGRRAAQAVAQARGELAALLGALPEEIVFTGGATEANNLALLGVARALPHRRHLVISAVEHPAVSQPASYLRESGWSVTIVPVDGSGRVAVADVVAALRPDTALVSIMHANNEVGTIQPIAEISRITRQRGVLLHTDAAQSVGKVPVNVDHLGVDLLTVAGHKFYAGKGVGALYVRTGTPIKPILFGGDQEHGLRPGTENVPQLVGLGAAATLAQQRLPRAGAELCERRDALHALLAKSIPGLVLNGPPEYRLPNTLHVSFPGVSGRDLLAACASALSASVGSACHAHGDAVSGVLAAMACDAERARGAVRLSVGRGTTGEQIEIAAAALIGAWRQLTK